MGKGETFMLVVAAIYTLIFCGIGILFRRIDIFSKLNHPLVKKHPNISKSFGTFFICFALVWFSIIVFNVFLN